jgi:hypothetical protein
MSSTYVVPNMPITGSNLAQKAIRQAEFLPAAVYCKWMFPLHFFSVEEIYAMANQVSGALKNDSS